MPICMPNKLQAQRTGVKMNCKNMSCINLLSKIKPSYITIISNGYKEEGAFFRFINEQKTRCNDSVWQKYKPKGSHKGGLYEY